MRASFIDVDGVRTRYLHAGSGDNVLLIHGYGFSADVWIRVLDPLAERFTVIAPDILGHGFTDWADPGDEPALLLITRHLIQLMDKLGIEKVAAVGSSLGGVLAPLMYFERPELVTSMVLGATHVPISDAGASDPSRLPTIMANGVKAMTDSTWQSCMDRIGNIIFDRESVPADIALIQATIYAQPDRIEAYTKIGESIMMHAQNEATRIYPERIQIPALFLCGREDIRMSIDIIEKNHSRIKNSAVIAFEKCGHIPEIEQPEKFVAAVGSFLAS